MRPGITARRDYDAARLTRRHGHQLRRSGFACLDDTLAVAGFYALNAHGIGRKYPPRRNRKKLPPYDVISAVYLSVVGVHVSGWKWFEPRVAGLTVTGRAG
jgi:hypothetical protein